MVRVKAIDKQEVRLYRVCATTVKTPSSCFWWCCCFLLTALDIAAVPSRLIRMWEGLVERRGVGWGRRFGYADTPLSQITFFINGYAKHSGQTPAPPINLHTQTLLECSQWPSMNYLFLLNLISWYIMYIHFFGLYYHYSQVILKLGSLHITAIFKEFLVHIK